MPCSKGSFQTDLEVNAVGKEEYIKLPELSFSGKKRWQCKVCLYIFEGDESPEKCPRCWAPKEEFVLLGDTVEDKVDELSPPTTDETEADVLVVGTGAAAFAAAITAQKQGCSVIMLEKAAIIGGTTKRSGGGFWTPNNRHQREAGITDAKEDAVKYMARQSYPLEVDANCKTKIYKAKKGIFFGTGGYSHNEELMLHFQRGPIFGGCAAPESTGDFIEWAQKSVLNLEIWRELFAHRAYLKMYWRTLTASFVANLKDTINKFNKYAKEGKDLDLQRGDYEYDLEWASIPPTKPGVNWPENPQGNYSMYPLAEGGPYYAVILASGTLDTNGGPIINKYSQVLNVHNKPIPGLYGVGNCIAAPSANAYWGGGGTIGPALTLGYIAGNQISK